MFAQDAERELTTLEIPDFYRVFEVYQYCPKYDLEEAEIEEPELTGTYAVKPEVATDEDNISVGLCSFWRRILHKDSYNNELFVGLEDHTQLYELLRRAGVIKEADLVWAEPSRHASEEDLNLTFLDYDKGAAFIERMNEFMYRRRAKLVEFASYGVEDAA
jgi:hypothetical protein